MFRRGRSRRFSSYSLQLMGSLRSSQVKHRRTRARRSLVNTAILKAEKDATNRCHGILWAIDRIPVSISLLINNLSTCVPDIFSRFPYLLIYIVAARGEESVYGRY